MTNPASRVLRWVGLPVQGVLLLLILAYRYTLSPYVGMHCRFEPTCSRYGYGAIRRHGVVWGIWLTVRRLLRCHPWGGMGYDPVPDAPPPWDRVLNRLVGGQDGRHGGDLDGDSSGTSERPSGDGSDQFSNGSTSRTGPERRAPNQLLDRE